MTISLCSSGDIPQLMAFIGQHWRHGHILSRNRRLLEWQYAEERLDNPESKGLYSIFLAKDAADIVGFLGFIPCRFALHGELVKGVWFAQWMVLEAYRHTGVGLGLVKAVKDLGFDVLSVLGINETVTLIYRSLGFEILEDFPRFIGVVGPERCQMMLCNLYPEANREMISAQVKSMALDGTTMPLSRPDIAFRNAAEAFDALAWDRFVEDFVQKNALTGTLRDSAYLTWRYLTHPEFSYQVLQVYRGDRLVGLLVFRVEVAGEKGYRFLRVMECLGNDEVVTQVVAYLYAYSARNGVDLIEWYCGNSVIAGILRETGLTEQPTRQKEAFAFPSRLQPVEPGYFKLSGAFKVEKPDWSGATSIVHSDGFYLTKSDGDMDRPN